jgi:hypothetical protein
MARAGETGPPVLGGPVEHNCARDEERSEADGGGRTSTAVGWGGKRRGCGAVAVRFLVSQAIVFFERKMTKPL